VSGSNLQELLYAVEIFDFFGELMEVEQRTVGFSTPSVVGGR
jgi:hypothetical protein